MEATRGPILFRCDGTPDQGWEPFYQCLSLAAALQRRRRGTHFFSYLDPLSLATVINRGNNDWVPAQQPLGTDGDLEAVHRHAKHRAALPRLHHDGRYRRAPRAADDRRRPCR